jgi:tryptophan halogenase
MNIVIVGGGTAGWLTALYAKKMYSKENVILVESEDIGILGAGEGSTGQLISFLDFLEIPISELIRNTKTTIKTGIKFSNWKLNEYYYHPFASKGISSENSVNYSHFDYYENTIDYSHVYAAVNNHKMKDYVLFHKLSDQNLIPFVEKPLSPISVTTDPIHDFEQHGVWSIHFDANLLASFLRKIGEQRGIIRKEGVVDEIKIDNLGRISKLKTNSELIDVDFVFDCTGFKRVIIGNFYNSEWKSHSELPAKRALPFFLPQDDNIPPYTEAIAMKYGWVWKIPLQHRYGCGYVFDTDFVSDDDAKKEIDNLMGFEVTSPRTFNFNAGCFKQIWIKNCVAIGLSSGFIEPLEATSILQSIRNLHRFFSEKTNLFTLNQKTIDRFNNFFLEETQEVVDFLYLHYITKRTDSDFWKNFIRNNKIPPFIEYILSVKDDRPLSDDYDFKNKSLFGSLAYNAVLIGNDLLDQNKLKRFSHNLYFNKSIEYQNVLRNQNIMMKNFVHHNDFIDYIIQA